MAAISFAGQNLANYNVFVDESEIFVTPEKDYEFIDVLGLNGRLTIDNHRFKDVTIPVNCFIRENFEENYHNLMNFLLSTDGYRMMYFSQDPNHTRQGMFYNAVKPDTGSFIQSGRFTLNFNCKPQRFLLGGSTTISTSGYVMTNPTNFKSKPLLRLVGNGSFKIEGDNTSYTIEVSGRGSTSATNYVFVDCESMVCYQRNNENASQYVTLYNGYPELTSGENTFTFTSDVTSGTRITVYPRWWEI